MARHLGHYVLQQRCALESNPLQVFCNNIKILIYPLGATSQLNRRLRAVVSCPRGICVSFNVTLCDVN